VSVPAAASKLREWEGDELEPVGEKRVGLSERGDEGDMMRTRVMRVAVETVRGMENLYEINAEVEVAGRMLTVRRDVIEGDLAAALNGLNQVLIQEARSEVLSWAERVRGEH